ncbi:MAG: hypothetical protein JOZ05_23610 [Acetobacteraceae bacterium]|nr:hypothetical protein [Acetobacteraceae bacterium]
MIRWRISVYDAVPTEAALDLPDGPARFIYAVEDGLTLRDRDGSTPLDRDSGRFCRGPAQLAGSGIAWIFEAGRDGALLAGAGISLVLSRPIAIEAPGPRLLRADRIESTSGSATPRHGHRGPGIRRLLYGRILGEIGDSFERIDPGHAWFESGTDPVVGTNVHTGNSAFVRVMVLPPELQGGKTSFVPTDAAEAAKPRAVQNRLFGEVLVEGVESS